MMEPVSDEQRIQIACRFIEASPPGEFNEVLNDVRILLENDSLLKEKSVKSFVQYNTSNFVPCQLEGSDDMVLITEHNMLPDDQFIDPATKQRFTFDHLRKSAGKTSAAPVDSQSEPFRAALQDAVKVYTRSHYPHGHCSVFGKSQGEEVTLIACIEDHQYQPNNFWNGRWLSQWEVVFKVGSAKAELKGKTRLQVHYYEDGNVQLLSNKEPVVEIPSFKGEKDLAAEVVKQIEAAENLYQKAIAENYASMSDTVFKALRRVLPITQSKLDWNKIVSYRVGRDLNKA